MQKTMLRVCYIHPRGCAVGFMPSAHLLGVCYIYIRVGIALLVYKDWFPKTTENERDKGSDTRAFCFL
jgi:hypothetical protein